MPIMQETQFAKWRKKVGLTQKEAAEALGIALTTVKQYEGGFHLSTGNEISPSTPVRKLMTGIASGIKLDAWPE